MIGLVKALTAVLAIATAVVAVALSAGAPGEAAMVATAGGTTGSGGLGGESATPVPGWLAGLIAVAAGATVWLALGPRMTREERAAIEALDGTGPASDLAPGIGRALERTRGR
ncbi:MAG: hypothetical protein ACFBWO_06450 [Paracoccaceae bacterium]